MCYLFTFSTVIAASLGEEVNPIQEDNREAVIEENDKELDSVLTSPPEPPEEEETENGSPTKPDEIETDNLDPEKEIDKLSQDQKEAGNKEETGGQDTTSAKIDTQEKGEELEKETDTPSNTDKDVTEEHESDDMSHGGSVGGQSETTSNHEEGHVNDEPQRNERNEAFRLKLTAFACLVFPAVQVYLYL